MLSVIQLCTALRVRLKSQLHVKIFVHVLGCKGKEMDNKKKKDKNKKWEMKRTKKKQMIHRVEKKTAMIGKREEKRNR